MYVIIIIIIIIIIIYFEIVHFFHAKPELDVFPYEVPQHLKTAHSGSSFREKYPV